MRPHSRFAAAALLAAALVGGCSGHPSEPTEALTFTFDFSRGRQGFIAGFADYPPAHAAIYELTADYRALPSPLEPQSALFLSGINRSDDLFMFFKGSVGGLSPGARYSATVSVDIATDTPAGCIGVGGAPGESVWIKAGATAVEPLPIRDGSYLRMNIDIGNQSTGGAQAVVLGNVANSRRCEQSRRWERKSFRGRPVPEPDLDSSRWPGLAAVRGRLGIREPDGDLLHPCIGDPHAGMTERAARCRLSARTFRRCPRRRLSSRRPPRRSPPRTVRGGCWRRTAGWSERPAAKFGTDRLCYSAPII